MPMNTQTVTSIMFLIWSIEEPREAPSIWTALPQTSVVKMPALKAMAVRATKVTSGTILATVATVLTKAAWVTPRSTMACISQSSTEAPMTAARLLPSPNTGKK